MQGWIETLYTQGSRVVTLSTYYKIDPTILWFIKTTGYYQRLILAYFMYKQAFRYLNHVNYCNNCIYAYVSPKVAPEFSAQKITLQMSMRYYEITKLKKICVEEKYNQYVKHTIA